ncbi:PaaI family thioesterase [Haloferax sp. Atlit-6N]|uniref:Esterase n=3 Tax=Haloferax gibbonsii TaxID=35746 RepID=A0A0K1IU47_HALGI|nr:esterase [Haloferax gibbonsii]RDZ53027.1 PaaI family thioesterase [Haloferax sp. Atlit-4N]REA02330.1 PaaI family thioesterase [Haloferax sp. Atlit-6N]
MPFDTLVRDMTDDFPAEAAAIVQRHIEDEHGYLSWLNTRVDAIERGRIVMTIPYDEKLTNTVSPPTIHGGIAATLIDTAGGIALRTMLDDPLAGGVATINLNVNYLRRASGDLTAVAEVVRAGGSVGVSTITVVSTDPEEDSDVAARQSPSSDWNDAVATGQGAYRLFRE